MSIKRCPADAAFSNAIRLNKNHTCEHCGRSDGRTECAHIFGRRHKSVRWDTMNALSLCHGCHRKFTENPLDFTTWLQGYLGQGYLDILTEKRNQIMKTNKALRAEIAKFYRGQVKLLEAGDHELESYR